MAEKSWILGATIVVALAPGARAADIFTAGGPEVSTIVLLNPVTGAQKVLVDYASFDPTYRPLGNFKYDAALNDSSWRYPIGTQGNRSVPGKSC